MIRKWTNTREETYRSPDFTMDKSLCRQILISITSSATLLSAGMNLGFSAVSLPRMQDVEGPDKLTVDEGSWFASISFIATLVGCFTCGPLMDAIGRKRTLLVVNSPFIVGWFLMWMAPKPAPVVLLYFARLFTGLGGGMISIPANIYIAEMASSSMRCMLVTWPSIAISIGILLIYALGLVTDSWRIIAAISTFVPIVTAVFIAICIRESPIWLAGRFRVEEAEKNFRWIRCINPEDEMPKELRNEFERIVKKGNKSLPGPEDLTLLGPLRKSYGANELQIEENAQRSISETLMATASTLKRPDVWKPLLILNTFFLFMQFSGVPVLIAYAVNIMMSEGVSLDPYFATLLLGIVKLVFEIVAGFVQNRYGRRPLSMISGLGMALCMVGLGLAHHFRAGGASWIPLLLIFAYVIAASVGFFLIPWAMLGEVYPTKVAGLACGITTCLGNLFGFASIKLFPTFVVAMGGTASGNSINAPEGVYYLYGGLTCLSVLFIALYLPETFQRSLQEISDDFKGPKRRLKCCSGD